MITHDQYVYLCQIQKDGSLEGGDSVNWTGHYIYCDGVISNEIDFKGFEKGFGGYVRHPEPLSTYFSFGAYYNNPWDGVISRDQLTGVIAGLIRNKERMALLRLIIHHSAWLFLFSYNTRINGQDPHQSKWKWPDITFADIWASYLRGFGAASWVFWPLLCVLDLHTLINTVFTNFSKDEDQISYMMKLMISREFVPTPTSWLSSKLLNKDHVLKLLNRYWSGWRQQPGMFVLTKRKMKDLNIITDDVL